MSDLAESLDRYGRYWAELTPETVEAIDELATPDFHFVDAFNDLTGREPFKRMLRHLQDSMKAISFEIEDQALSLDAPRGYLHWRCHYQTRLGPRPGEVVGVAEIHFDAQGRIAAHIDHADTGTQIFERVPLLGFGIRRVKAKFRTS